MAMKTESNMPNWRLRLAAELRRDKKKTTMLVGLVVIAGVLAGKILVKQISSAGASQGPTGSALVVSEASSAGALKASAEASQAKKSTRTPHAAAFTKDIFRIQWDRFASKGRPVSSARADKTARVRVMSVDQTKRRVIESQAQRLVLQSIIGGTTPTVIINGRVVRLGRTINGFRVISVAAHSCVIQKDGVILTIQLQGWSDPVESRVDGGSDNGSFLESGKER